MQCNWWDGLRGGLWDEGAEEDQEGFGEEEYQLRPQADAEPAQLYLSVT